MKKDLPNAMVVETYPAPEAPVRTASCRPLPTGNGPVPINPVSPAVQLSPIITPIAMVPYTTQEQELMMYDYADVVEEEPVAEAVAPVAVAPAKEKKRIRICPVLLILCSLLILAVYIVGNFVIPEYLALIGTEASGSGLGIILGLFEGIDTSNIMTLIPTIAIVATAVAVVVVLVASLIGITRKKATVVAKIALVLGLLFALVALGVQIFTGASGIGIGMYIVTGLCLVAFIIGFLVRTRK